MGTMGTMGIKIFANSDLVATIPCPECGKSYQKNVSKFIKHKTRVKLKYTCKCRHRFTVLLERRRAIRKKVLFKGYLIEQKDKIPLTIGDISKFGIRINFTRQVHFELDSVIDVEFTLDDANCSSVSTKVKIKRFISPLCAGCEFFSHEHYDNLGKYFLFNF